MTLDEAIARERELAEMHRNNIVPKENYRNMPWIDKNNEASMRNAEEHEHLAEWLEDYKRIKMLIPIEQALKAEYNKAIDDLRNELKNHYTEYNIDCVLEDNNFYSYTTACNYLEDYIDEIAEQLKAGVENES